MKSGFAFRFWLAGIFLVLTIFGKAEPKQIRLRHQIIRTEAPARPAANSTLHLSEAPVSGLFLIQFTASFQPEWRTQLEQQNVELLRYVPDDSFIVRLKNVRRGQLRKLPFVQWIGPYRPEYKIHDRLRPEKALAADNDISIKLLLTPNADAKDIKDLRQLFKKAERESSPRFGKILEGSIAPAQLNALANSSAVLWIESAPKMKLFDEIATKIIAGDDGHSGTQASVHQFGFTGADVTVAVADSGLHLGQDGPMHPDLDGRVDAFFHYGTLEDAADEHSHGTHVTGIVAGNGATGEADEEGYLHGLGAAPEARIVAQRIFDGEGGYHAPPTFETMTRDAVRAGAEIGSNSWGDDTQGRYDLSAAEFDELVRDADTGTAGDQPYILEFSAGNAGPGEQTIGSPAVAKNVIATGASENNRFNLPLPELAFYDSGQETMADFSSRGPCEDGRIKPDVTAPGTWIASLRSALANDENAWAPISNNYLYQGGTSQAGPAVSGAAAVFVQFYRDTISNSTPSPALVKAALINSSVDMDESGGTTSIPNQDEGWGRVDLGEIINSSLQFEFLDQTALLTHGQIFEKRVLVGSPNERLKITLTYTDVAGFPGAIPALVNDLDLEVIAPNGNIFHGNQFAAGESVPHVQAFDNINNVEGIHLRAPFPGEYIIRVHARNVAEDARRDTPVTDQDFALVISADIPEPGMGILFFDRSSYSVPAVANLRLIDAGLAGQSSITVLVSSETEGGGETIVLQSIGSTGVFTGSVATATGAPIADGKIQISHGNTIKAIYQDASPAGIRTATAQADLLPPLITNVVVTNHFGRMILSWQTDEPADSRVRLGTNVNLSLSLSNSQFVLSHEIVLENLVGGQTYFFAVASTDAAGNAATNNNGGSLFSFVAAPPAVILLVDSYTDQFFAVPPLAGYTDALDQVGLAYEVWSVPDNGSPTFNDLKPFKAVIWRVPEFESLALTPSERTALTNYLAGGGSLLIASMEATTRLDESGAASFRSNVLQIVNFVADPPEGVPAIVGASNDPITSGLDILLDYAVYEDELKEFIGLPPDISDTLTISSNAAPIFFDDLGRVVGLRYPRIGQDSQGRVVYLSFPLDAVPMTGTDPNNRPNLLRNLLSFLIPGVNGLGAIALNQAAYTIPSLVTVEVADSDLAGVGQISVNFFSHTATNGQSVVLNETPRPGLFRGAITVVSHTNNFQTGELRVADGDSIWAEYFDTSANGIARALAQIDTVPPVIADVAAEPEYITAVIAWTTSKPTDALVQFGESTFFSRTAYASEFVDEHSISLSGLQPDRIYYFQVVSRDAAGNTVVDNNEGSFYTFQTLRPLSTPVWENFESGSTNWVVLDGEPGTTTWRLGAPQNGLETEANSPTNCWGSNLDGNNIDFGDTMLISPAIYLSGGSRATLRFWHSYDFSSQSEGDIYEYGETYISTDEGQNWTLLETFFEFSFGWEEAEYDLSAYAGQVIRIGFYYGLFAFDPANHPGWLIDDFTIETSGDIQITNNLSQAQFTLSGPLSASGSGSHTIISNAPSGEYVVTFLPVPFYTTPVPQTNTMSAAGPLIFRGTYTFADANTNGISDLWEQQFFGEVSPNRITSTDTDGDGMTDYAEFMAGTIPTNVNSSLHVTPLLTNSTLRLDWLAVEGRAYQLQGSTNAMNWTSVFGWMMATNTNASLILPPFTNGAPYLFRLQVKP